MQLSKSFVKLQNVTDADFESERMKAATLSKIETEIRTEVAKIKEQQDIELGIERSRKEVLLRLYENDFFHISWFIANGTYSFILFEQKNNRSN